MGNKILEVKNLSKNFGGLKALNNCSVSIEEGSITGIIGPNGSGKSTLFNVITGNLPPTNGTIYYNNQNITGIPSYDLFSMGILRTFQIAHEFTNLTVLENLMMVPGNQKGEKLIYTWFNPRLVKEEDKIIRDKALDVLDFLNLNHLTNEIAGNLSGGQKKTS